MSGLCCDYTDKKAASEAYGGEFNGLSMNSNSLNDRHIDIN